MYIIQYVFYRIFYADYILFPAIYIINHGINRSGFSAASRQWNKIATFKAITILKDSQITTNTVGDKIKKYRLISNLSQRKLAKLTKTSKTRIYSFEYNKLCPKLELLNKMAEIFKIDAKQFMDDYLLFIYNPNYKNFFIELKAKNDWTYRDIKNILGFSLSNYLTWQKGIKISKINYIKLRNALFKLKIYDMKKYIIY
ncbi:helix-turn-helix domain-containing protein [Clostridium sp. Mt-5]|uniref:Helix-turn-helix domain-containing protein n=1 Tax=Clostridium moutaii TaxID=3240932 RepID=A0ABV4BP68_9CLOT